MGNVAQTVPRVVLRTDIQLHFKAGTVKTDVGELVTGWIQDGAPLGLTLEMFEQVLGLQARADVFFAVFDTDKNCKVDAFEVLSAAVVLAEGSLDDKIEVLFPIFDFSGDDKLNFDEINILVHSVYRGLQKVCSTPSIPDSDIIDVCRHMFDAHNMPYDRMLSREQMKRWLRVDVDASSFIDIFHHAYSLPDIEVVLAQKEQLQTAVFSELCGASSVVPVYELQGSEAFRKSLSNPPDEDFQGLLAGMRRGGVSIDLEHFMEAVRAYNAFDVLDSAKHGVLSAKELRVLMRMFYRQEPPEAAFKKMFEALELGPDKGISKSAWFGVSLDG
jgi:Ca2+-binding EF-hand superfamily protein